jgi:hypothetical protein
MLSTQTLSQPAADVSIKLALTPCPRQTVSSSYRKLSPVRKMKKEPILLLLQQ